MANTLGGDAWNPKNKSQKTRSTKMKFSKNIKIFVAAAICGALFAPAALQATYSPTWDTGSTNLTTVGTVTNGTWSATAIAVNKGGTGATTASNARTNLGLAIGTDVQAYSSVLSNVAAGTYTGDDSIDTVGTITSGTWSGSTIAVNKGGTGLTSYTSGSLVYASGATTLAQIAPNSSGTAKYLSQTSSGAPTWESISVDLSSATGTLPITNGGTGATSASNARTNLGLAIGSDVQAYDADLSAIAGLTSAADKGIQFTGSGTAGTYDLTSFAKTLLDDANASTARSTLGLGSSDSVVHAGVSATSTFKLGVQSATATANISKPIVLVDASSGSGKETFTLPAPAADLVYEIKKTDSSAVVVRLAHNSTEKIDGADYKDITVQYGAIRVVCNGTDWFQI